MRRVLPEPFKIVSSPVPFGGLIYAAWMDRSWTKGLAVSQTEFGINIAEDIQSGFVIARGDGLQRLVCAVDRFYQCGCPADEEA